MRSEWGEEWWNAPLAPAVTLRQAPHAEARGVAATTKNGPYKCPFLLMLVLARVTQSLEGTLEGTRVSRERWARAGLRCGVSVPAEVSPCEVWWEPRAAADMASAEDQL